MTTGSRAATARAFTAQYETVRAWALARPRPALGPAGATVLLQQGVAAWLRAWPTWHPVSSHEPGAPRGPTAPRVMLAERSRALASVLATMVEHCQHQQEERL